MFVFGADSGLCLSWCLILGHNRNLDHMSFFSLGRYVDEFIQIISFYEKAHLNSGVRLLLELYCVIVIKHFTFFTICAKLQVTVAFTFTFRIWRKILADCRIWRKKGTVGGFEYPYSPPPSFIAKICWDICPRSLSVPSNEQFSESVEEGMLFFLIGTNLEQCTNC